MTLTGSTPGLAPPELRGSLDVADGVVEKIAATALGEGSRPRRCRPTRPRGGIGRRRARCPPAGHRHRVGERRGPGRGRLGRLPGYVAIAVAVVVGLLSLRWLLAQVLRKPKTGTWRLPAAPIEGGDRGCTVIAADRAAEALATDIETYPGVRSASAALTGPRHRPDLHLDVTAGTDVVLAELRERLTGHALPRLCSALDIEGLHAQMILRLDTNKAAAPHVR